LGWELSLGATAPPTPLSGYGQHPNPENEPSLLVFGGWDLSLGPGHPSHPSTPKMGSKGSFSG